MNHPKPISATERSLRQRTLASFRRAFDGAPARIVVGFSGGVDSLALALTLKGLQPLLQPEIVLIHVDHGMRDESRSDAERASVLADRIGLPIDFVTSEELPQALHPGVGPEEAARRVRYAAFAALAGAQDAVALAHHAEDQAETVLLHLLRGCGTDGLAGMSEVNSISVPWWSSSMKRSPVTVWRPLLRELKGDLRTICEHHELEPIRDQSNDNDEFRRNAVRHRLMPVLMELEPTIVERIGDLTQIVIAENALIEQIVREHVLANGHRLTVDAVEHTTPAISRRLIRSWFHERLGLTLSFERVEAVRRLVENGKSPARIEIGEGVSAWFDGEEVRAERREDPGRT